MWPVVKGTISRGGVVEAVVNMPLDDNVATTIARIVQTNEAGSTDGGGYVCFIQLLVGDGAAASSGAAATDAMQSFFVRANEGDGTCDTGAVSSSSCLGAQSDAAARTVTITSVTAVSVNNALVYIDVTADHTGSSSTSLYVVAHIRVIWMGYVSPPIIVNQT
jgi:hypothetical protein